MNEGPALGQQFFRNRFGPLLYPYLHNPKLEYFPGMVDQGRLEVRPPEVDSDIGDFCPVIWTETFRAHRRRNCLRECQTGNLSPSLFRPKGPLETERRQWYR